MKIPVRGNFPTIPQKKIQGGERRGRLPTAQVPSIQLETLIYSYFSHQLFFLTHIRALITGKCMMSGLQPLFKKEGSKGR